MKRMVLIAAGVLALVLFASGMFFEWVWLALSGEHVSDARLEDAFFLSSLFDIVLVGLAAAALSWPFYRRVRHLQRVAQQQREGDTAIRAELSGSDVLAELGQSFDALADANAQHQDNQRALLRAVSHELRTPVARLRFALAELVTAEGDRRGQVREAAEVDIDELDALVDEVLSYVRVGPGGEPRNTESFELGPMLRELQSQYPGVEVEAPDAVQLVGEPHLVRRALSNLVRNAVAHAKETTQIVVHVGDVVEFVVTDDGPGLPDDADERIFLPFVRLNDRPDGTGLGLSIAHAIAKRHGGHLAFTRRPPGHGAEFRLTLPQS